MTARIAKALAYAETRKSWGGCTIHQVTGEWVAQGIDAYAVSIARTDAETISVPADASYAEFSEAFDKALAQFGHATYLGIFHDDEKGTVDFDPTEVVPTRADVDALAESYPVTGGAYHFQTGDGYWPNGNPSDWDV